MLSTLFAIVIFLLVTATGGGSRLCSRCWSCSRNNLLLLCCRHLDLHRLLLRFFTDFTAVPFVAANALAHAAESQIEDHEAVQNARHYDPKDDSLSDNLLGKFGAEVGLDEVLVRPSLIIVILKEVVGIVVHSSTTHLVLGVLQIQGQFGLGRLDRLATELTVTLRVVRHEAC